MVKDEPEVRAYLKGLDLEGLVALRDRLDGMIADRVEARRRELMAEVERLSSFIRNSQTAAKPTAKHVSATEQKNYRSDADPSLVWARRGRRGRLPKWLVEEMAATGKPLEFFLMDEAASDEASVDLKS